MSDKLKADPPADRQPQTGLPFRILEGPRGPVVEFEDLVDAPGPSRLVEVEEVVTDEHGRERRRPVLQPVTENAPKSIPFRMDEGVRPARQIIALVKMYRELERCYTLLLAETDRLRRQIKERQR